MIAWIKGLFGPTKPKAEKVVCPCKHCCAEIELKYDICEHSQRQVYRGPWWYCHSCAQWLRPIGGW